MKMNLCLILLIFLFPAYVFSGEASPSKKIEDEWRVALEEMFIKLGWSKNKKVKDGKAYLKYMYGTYTLKFEKGKVTVSNMGKSKIEKYDVIAEVDKRVLIIRKHNRFKTEFVIRFINNDTILYGRKKNQDAAHVILKRVKR